MIVWLIAAATAAAIVLGLGILVFHLVATGGIGAQVDPLLGLETWTAANDGTHNSNSHMVHWRGEFWLVHASSPYHFSTPKSKLILLRSADAVNWEKMREFKIPGEDIRDPKLAVIGGRLHLYVLKSVSFRALPYLTAHSSSEDGTVWTSLSDLREQEGWIFWNPSLVRRYTLVCTRILAPVR